MDWQAVVAEKQRRRAAILNAILPQVKDTAFDDNVASIRGHEDIATLTSRMSKGEITAEAVTLSFVKR